MNTLLTWTVISHCNICGKPYELWELAEYWFGFRRVHVCISCENEARKHGCEKVQAESKTM